MACGKKKPEPRGNAASGTLMRTDEGRERQTAYDPLLRKSLLTRNAKGEVLLISDGTRLADVLLKLSASGKRGISAFDFPPGVRLGGLIFKLRRLGLAIETQRKPVPGDPFGARIANYRLTTAL